MVEKVEKIATSNAFKALVRDKFHKVETVFAITTSNQKIPAGSLSIIDEKTDIYMPLSFDGIPKHTFKMRVPSPSREFKLFTDNIVGKGIRKRDTPIEINGLFFSKGIKDFLEHVETDQSVYLEKGKEYKVDKCYTGKGENASTLTVVFNSGGTTFNMHILNSNTAHIQRLENFFSARVHSKSPIVPKENISPVIASEDINKLFSALDPYEPRILKGKAYKLESVIRRETENMVFLVLHEYGKQNPILYPIQTYGESADSGDERSFQSVAEYFGRHLSNGFDTYITPAIDIYDNMLDFMRANPEVFVLKFGILEKDSREIKDFIDGFVQKSPIKWNTSYTTSWNGIHKKFYPDAVQ